jgi:hypothetical protein
MSLAGPIVAEKEISKLKDKLDLTYNNSTQSPLALAVGCSVAPFRGRELS